VPPLAPTTTTSSVRSSFAATSFPATETRPRVTGNPKGVFSGLLSPAAAQALVAEERDLWGFSPDDVNLVLSPLHHSAPLRFAMGTLLAGGRIEVPGRFDPERITAAIRTERPTTMFCVPTHLQRLFAHWDEVGIPDLSSFRLVAHAGAPCPPAIKQRVVDAFPAGSTWEFYGSTEGHFTACRSEEWLTHPGTVGRARPGRSITADADGYVHLDGRRDDLVISGGVNVYPLEVENALREVPGVEDVAVFGMPDPEWGQRVCAAVVGAADEAVLRGHAGGVLAPAKRPKTYVRVAELPLTATGKVRRDQLPQLICGP